MTYRFIVIAALMLSGCGSRESALCVTPRAYPEHDGTPDLDEQTLIVDACLQQWSRRLALGPDSLREVSDAVAAACDGAVINQALLFAVNTKRVDNLPVAPEPDDEGFRADAKRTALVLVAQARAGKCPLP